MIYDEFWRDRVDGMSLNDLVTHLRTATDPSRIPLSLVALDGDWLVGTINLIENDDRRVRTYARGWRRSWWPPMFAGKGSARAAGARAVD